MALLELDGPLFDLPFGALVIAQTTQNEPIYLIERASLETIPGALLFERQAPAVMAGFSVSAIRFTTRRIPGTWGIAPNRDRGKQAITLARVAATSEELEACARV